VLSPALRRFLRYLRPHAGLMVLTVPASLGALAASTTIPLVIRAVIDGPIAQHRPALLLPYGLSLLGLAGLELAANFARRNASTLASLRMEFELRNEFYAHLQSLQVAFHDNWQSGQLLSRAITDIQTVRRFVGTGLVFAAYFSLQWVAVLAMLVRLDWQLALVSTAVVAPVALISRGFFRRYARIARRIQDQQGDLATVVEEMATGVRVIKGFGRELVMRERFTAKAARLRHSNLEAVGLRSRTWSAFTLLLNLDLCLVLLLGGLAVARDQLTIGSLVAFMTYLFMLVWPLDALGWVLAMYEEASTAAGRLTEVLDQHPEVTDRQSVRPLARLRGHVRLESVSFRYSTGGWALRDLEMEVKPGETLALVGPTGSGKSTLIALIPRLYDVSGGRITLDGVDVRDLPLRWLRSQIGIAFEDPILFSASVRENLVMGRPGITDQDLRRVLEMVRADFVWDLPWGIETRIGEQGYSLSGGQRQRLALARAVLGRPRVLVLDDPLSAVDIHTESEIQEALANVLRDVSALIVAHRPSTVALADRVALLDRGRIVAMGSHAQLLQTSSQYRALLAEGEGDPILPEVTLGHWSSPGQEAS
jgi:ATP-binding cassette subfamily B protein